MLKDIVEILEKTKIIIQCAYLQKLEISAVVSDIVSNCLEIKPEQIIHTASFADDLEVESLSWFELVLALKNIFSMEIYGF